MLIFGSLFKRLQLHALSPVDLYPVLRLCCIQETGSLIRDCHVVNDIYLQLECSYNYPLLLDTSSTSALLFCHAKERNLAVLVSLAVC